MIPCEEDNNRLIFAAGRNLSDEKTYNGTMTHKIGNTMGYLEVSPIQSPDYINTTRCNPIHSP